MVKQTGWENAAALLSWAIIACLLTLLNTFVGAFVRLPPFPSLAGHLLAVIYLAALLLSLMNTARAAVRLPVSTPFLLLAGMVLSLPTLLQILSSVAHLPTTLDILAAFLPFKVQLAVSNLLAPIGMTLLGAGIGRIIKHPNTLLAGAGVAIFFDIVVVTMGTVAQLLKNNASAIAAVSVGAGGGTAHSSAGGGPALNLPPPVCGVTIGPADVLFIALFLSAVWHLRLSNRATFAWMFLLLFAALVLVETTSLPIPALAPMGVAVLIANIRHAAFTQREKRDLAIGAAFAVFCAGLMVVGARRFIQPSPPMYGFTLSRLGGNGPLLIQELTRESLAQKAGLLPGDVITAVNGIPTRGMAEEKFIELRDQSWKKGGLRLTVERPHLPPRDYVLKPAG